MVKKKWLLVQKIKQSLANVLLVKYLAIYGTHISMP